MNNRYESFAEAYKSTVAEVMKTGRTCEPVLDKTSVGSQFGKKSRFTREIVGHQFTVNNPSLREISSKARPINVVFNRANFLWTLTGGGNVEGISYYNGRGRVFAKDSAFYEAAFGARLFYPFQQFRLVENRLKKDKASRRGLAMIYIPEDTQVDKLDTPCATYLHFMVRDDKLICICNMRSQSALMVLPYDFFLFSMIHECLAVRLQLDLGKMIYTSNSFHIYDDEFGAAEEFVGCDCTVKHSLPNMTDASDNMLGYIIEEEQKLRLTNRSDISMKSSTLDKYWIRFFEPIQEFTKST